MAEFRAFRPDVEVCGAAVLALVDGMGQFTTTALKILGKNGIEKPKPDHWYPQQAWLDSFKTIAERIGPLTLFAIGKKLPDTVDWPPTGDSLEELLGSIDLTYHMSHRIGGDLLFNPDTGQMTEGIGHYRFNGTTGPYSAEMVCDNPYPSEFDRGIITTISRRFKPHCEVKLDPGKTSRPEGGESCTYLIEW
jgi:hypothetical protein